MTIVEFGDLECPACKAAQPNITKLMQDEPKARLVFVEFSADADSQMGADGRQVRGLPGPGK